MNGGFILRTFRGSHFVKKTKRGIGVVCSNSGSYIQKEYKHIYTYIVEKIFY